LKETLRYQPYDQDKYPVPNCTLYRQYILILTIRSHGGREMMRRLCTARSSFACNTRRSSVLAVDNPFTGETYVEVPVESAEETVRKVERSAAAQRVFAAETSLEDRIALCARFMEAFEADKERIAQDITGQMGKPFHNALGEVRGMFERCEGMMALAPAALAPEVLPAKDNFSREIVKDPVGVVLCVAPWNYPLLTTVNCVVPAVLAGNGVVIKHSPRTPLCGDAFARAFEAAGTPEGLVTGLTCADESVHTAIAHDDVGFVSFTGSVRGGRAIYSSVASERFIDATLELGGKDPGYVAEDANMKAAVATLVDGAFFNAGQSCCGIERVYVHESRYNDFLEAAAAEINATLKLGDPMDTATTMGPMALPGSPAFLQAQIDDAVAKGAKVLTGGSVPRKDDNAALATGRFFRPTLLAGCDHSMDVMRDESFGPVLGVAPVASDEEAIAKMNDSAFGLTACAFTADAGRAAAMGRQLKVGTFFMNRCDYLDPMLPWGGTGDTGKGVSLSSHGFRGVTKLKGMHLKFDPAK
jgi:acyl-CoA reductase-like NAD-dependent aldehyde dehydrogenase